MKKFVDEQGGKWRGLTFETLSKFGCLYHAEYMVAANEKVPVVIFPYDENLYFWREVNGTRRGVPSGAKRNKLYKALPISIDYPNFIIEGEIDALSVAAVLGEYELVGCVATGGASNYRTAVTEIEKRFANAERKPSFIVMFDNDKSGKTNGFKLVNDLRAAGYPTEPFFLEERMAGEFEYHKSDGTVDIVTVKKIDANDLLQRGVLNGRLFEGIEQTAPELKVQELAMKRAAEQERQAAIDKSGIKIFSFADYFATDFFRDIALTAKYSERKTGFKNLDAAQIFLPGLYILGALPATGKTTFAWQLLNQLAENGEHCVYCSFEMSRAELFTKSISRELFQRYPDLSERLKLSSANIRRGACSELEELHKQAALFAKSSTNLQVAELSNTSVTELIERLKPLVANVDKSLVICLDYLQIMPSKGSSSPKEKIDDTMLRLKDFQRETNSTLIVISSFNRENYFQPVGFSAFKESGAIEYSADVVWGLENYGVNEKNELDKEEVIKISKEKVRKIHFVCLKNRNGGQYDTFFRYYAAHDFFEPLEKEDERPIHEK